jgi:hypothetical protein
MGYYTEVSEKLNPKHANAATRLPMHLCPPTLIIEVVKVMDASGEKADPTRYAYNWRDSETFLVDYIDAMKRHIAALEDGQWLDPKSGRPHVAHVASSCGIILDADKAGTLKRNTPSVSCGVAEQLQEYEDDQKAKLSLSKRKHGVFYRLQQGIRPKRSEDVPGEFNTYQEAHEAAEAQNKLIGAVPNTNGKPYYEARMILD